MRQRMKTETGFALEGLGFVDLAIHIDVLIRVRVAFYRYVVVDEPVSSRLEVGVNYAILSAHPLLSPFFRHIKVFSAVIDMLIILDLHAISVSVKFFSVWKDGKQRRTPEGTLAS